MADWLDGPKFVAWLESTNEDFESVVFGPAIHRRVVSWRQGHAASVWTVDPILTQIGLHISLIPEELWLEKAPKPRLRQVQKAFPAETKEAVIRRRRQGASPRQLAAEIGVSERTIRKWMRESKRKEEQSALSD